MKKHLFLFILTLAVLSVSNVWADTTLSFIYSSVGQDKYCDGSDSDKDKGIKDSDFRWSGAQYDAVELNGGWVGVANDKTACSRSTTYLAAGDYTFTMNVKWTEGGTRNLPQITITGLSAKNPDIGSSYTFTNNETKSLVYTFNGLSAGDYEVSVYFPHGERSKQFIQTLVIAPKAPACTAPNHVDVTPTSEEGNYGWRYSLGETLKLTATAYSSAGTSSPIDAEDITGYQWQKYVGSAWSDIEDDSNISGATTANLQISNLTTSNGGSYRCNISTGAACKTSSDGYFVRIFTMYGGYSGGSYTHEKITWTGEKEGTVTVNLNANSTYKFKVTDNNGRWFGNGGTITEDLASNWVWGFGTSDGDATLNTEALGAGEFVFTFDITHFDDGGSKYVNLRSLTYPRKSIYVIPNGYTGDNGKLSIYYWRSSNGWSSFLATDDCSNGKYSAEIPGWAQYFSIVRHNSSAGSPSWDNKWNQTVDITANASYDQYEVNTWCSGENCKEGVTAGTFSVPTFTVTYNANGNGAGNATGTTGSVPTDSNSPYDCGSDVTILGNTGSLAKEGHDFDGWNTAADGSGDPYIASGTLSSITANTILYAQWEKKSYTLTWDLAGGTVATAGTAAAKDATGTPSDDVEYGTLLTAPVVTKTGYDFDEWSPSVASTMPASDTEYTATWTIKTTAITIDANTTYHGSTGSSVTATWGSALPSFTAASGVAGYGLIGYYTGANDGTKVINADGTLVQNVTGYTSNDATPVWIYETSTLTLYPHYEEMTTYSVTVNRNNDSYGTVTGASSYAEGAMVNISATPAGGYEFVNWTTSSDGVTFADANSASTSFTMIGSTVTVTANFRAETCESDTLEVEDDFVIVTPGVGARTTPQGEGWYNSGWYTGFHGNGFFDMRGSDGEIYLPVHLNGGTYSFTIYNLNGKNKRLRLYSKTSSAYTTITYSGDTYYRMSNDGYTVTGRDEDAHQGTAFVSCLIENVALSAGDYIIGLKSDDWASWDQVVITNSTTYTVTYNATGAATGSTISAVDESSSAVSSGSSVSACTEVTFTATPAAGYVVEHWQVGGVTYAAFDGLDEFTLTINRNVTVTYTTVEASAYAVTVNTNNGSYGSASADAATYASGATVTLTATPQPGYRFVNWTTTSDGITFANANSASTTFTMIASAVTVQANFAEATCMSTKTIEAESYIPDWFAYREGAGISKPTDGEFSGTSYVQFNQETEINYFVSLPAANYRFHIYHGGTGNNKYFNLYGLDDSAGSDYVTYNGHKYKNTAYKGTALNAGGSRWTDEVVTCDDLPANDYIIGLYGNDGSYIIYDKIVIEAYGNVDNNVFCYHSITMNTTVGADGEATSGVARALLGDIVTISAPAASSGYHFTGWTASPSVTFTSDPSVASNSFTMPDENVTLTANYALDELTISSLPWAGDQDLTGQTVVSAAAISSCFDSEITFTFTGTGTVNYYDNTNRSSSLGTVTSGTAITLDDDLRTHGIYIRCTSGSAMLTGVSKTTVGSVYTIWSGSVVVSANYTGVNEAGEEVTLSAEAQDWWLQQVVLGPEHFQTAAVGDTLRVTYTNIENGDAKGAIQTATKYNAIPGNIYKESDGSQVTTNTHDFDLPNSGYYHIITAGSLDSLKNKGIVVKGKGHTITRISLHASCSNLSLRTTAPDVRIHGADGSIDIMTNKLEFEGEGFNLGNWEHKLELDERCFNSVTVGSIINFYMKVEDGATLSFRCNVPSIIADDKQDGEGCPSYGDISFDRTIDDLYGAAPTLIGRIQGYKVLYLLVDADMLRRLKETGMILCGKGTLIKVVEGVPETVVVNPGIEKNVPTVVNNLTIYQGGKVTNDEDIEVLGNITYIRPAHDDGQDGKLGNKLDQWYTFALPFTVSDVEVYDEAEETWYDINAVYYSRDDIDQVANNPDSAGHYYLQYLSKEEIASDREEFINRWQYITPGHSLACVSQYVANDGTRHGYPKKDEAYIILFDSEQPIGPYFQTNTEIRFVGRGPQTIEGVAKQWKVTSDGDEYWMYANNTLHSFTLDGDAYILNDEGTYFILQSEPTIRPFECYVQATVSLKDKYAAIPMRGFHIDNTPTGAESIQGSAIRAEKILRNGQLIIIRNGVAYDATGVVIR